MKVDEKTKRFPFVTLMLIIICFVTFWNQSRLFTNPGLVPLDILHSILNFDNALPEMLLSFVTAFFIHGSIMHLIGNVWYLWIFGNALEQQLSRRGFFFAYCLFGVVSMAVQVASDPLSSIPIVGASGAIAGVMGMYLVLCPFSRLLIWFPPIFFFRPPSALFLAGWFWLQWHNVQNGGAEAGNIAWWAHIGGFAIGIPLGIYVKMGGLSESYIRGKKRKKQRVSG